MICRLDKRARGYSLRDAEGLQHPAPAPPRVTFCLLRDKWPKEDFLQFLSNGKVPSGQVWKCPSEHRPMSPSAGETPLGTPCLEIKVFFSHLQSPEPLIPVILPGCFTSP